jgi:1,2-diacylglycerol 3-alpha-glucosyltransferase
MASCLLPNSETRRISVCFVFRDVGHYHDARLGAAAAEIGSGNLAVVEICNRSHFEVFSREPGKGTTYQRYTLFPGKMFGVVPATEMRRSLFSRLRSLNPEVIAVPGWSGREALASLAWAVDSSVPVVMMSESQRRDHRRNWLGDGIKRRLLRMCSAALVGGSPQVAYAEELGLARERIFTGYDVVDNEHFRLGAERARQDPALRTRLGLPERFYLVCCRFVVQKNLLRLLEAYSRYCRSCASPWGLVILGDGPLRPEAERHIRGLGLEKHVSAPGAISYDALPAYYGLASAFVLPSVIEPWGLVVNEAMAAGLPVLVSEHCGCAQDLVERGRNGFTFDPCNIEEQASLMLSLSSTPETERNAMGLASLEIIGRWSPKFFAESLEKAVQAALSAPPPNISVLDRALLGLLLHR